MLLPGVATGYGTGAAPLGAIAIVVGLAVGLSTGPGALAVALACIIGPLSERWLFFADARHRVRLFHGDRRN